MGTPYREHFVADPAMHALSPSFGGFDAATRRPRLSQALERQMADQSAAVMTLPLVHDLDQALRGHGFQLLG